MDNEKFTEIGEKLSVNVSDLQKSKISRNINKIKYFILQGAILSFSAIISNRLGNSKATATYPTGHIILAGPASLLIVTMHLGNGFYSISEEKIYDLGRKIRILFFLTNLLLSLFLFISLYIAVPEVQYPPGATPMYGVFSKDLE